MLSETEMRQEVIKKRYKKPLKDRTKSGQKKNPEADRRNSLNIYKTRLDLPLQTSATEGRESINRIPGGDQSFGREWRNRHREKKPARDN